MIRRLQRTDHATAAPSRLQRLTRPAKVALPALAAASALTACVPYTTYRYTGFTPAARPIAWDGAVPERGEAHAEATISHAAVSPELLPVEHSTALNLAATTLEGAVGIGLFRGLDVGLRATYSSYDWSQPSSLGTMPLPLRPSLFGFGPEVKLAFALDPERRFSFGFTANALLYSLPWALWQAGDCSPSCAYTVVRQDSDSTLVFSGGFYPSYAFGDGGRLGNIFLMMGAHTDFKNDGFTDTQASGSTIQTSGLVGLIGGGGSLHVGGAKLGLLLFTPFTRAADGARQMPGAMLTLGWDSRPAVAAAAPAAATPVL